MGFTDLNNGGGGGPGSTGFGTIPTIFSKHLDTNGDGTGIKNAIGDYSVTPEIFYIQPSSTEIIRVWRMMVLVSGPKGRFYTDSYGSRDMLTNGVQVRAQDDSGTLIDFTDDVTIKTNGEWGQFCYDAEVYAGTLGNLNTYLRVRWTFANSGYPLRLVGANNERLEVVLNDDFSLNNGTSDPLVEQYFVVQGYFESNE